MLIGVSITSVEGESPKGTESAQIIRTASDYLGRSRLSDFTSSMVWSTVFTYACRTLTQLQSEQQQELSCGELGLTLQNRKKFVELANLNNLMQFLSQSWNRPNSQR